MTAHERTGWRDHLISTWHREWGDDAPMVDIDMLVIEYDQRVPVAIIDYKKGMAWTESASDRSNLAAQSTLATMAGLPFLIVRYTAAREFSLEPRNEIAQAKIPESRCRVALNELRYVTFLYWLRGRPMPDLIARAIECRA